MNFHKERSFDQIVCSATKIFDCKENNITGLLQNLYDLFISITLYTMFTFLIEYWALDELY